MALGLTLGKVHSWCQDFRENVEEALRILSVMSSQASPTEDCSFSSPWKRVFRLLISFHVGNFQVFTYFSERSYPKAVSTAASEGTPSLVRSHKDSETRKSVKKSNGSGFEFGVSRDTFLENASDRSAHVDNRVGGVVCVNHTVVWRVWIAASKKASACC